MFTSPLTMDTMRRQTVVYDAESVPICICRQRDHEEHARCIVHAVNQGFPRDNLDEILAAYTTPAQREEMRAELLRWGFVLVPAPEALGIVLRHLEGCAPTLGVTQFRHQDGGLTRDSYLIHFPGGLHNVPGLTWTTHGGYYLDSQDYIVAVNARGGVLRTWKEQLKNPELNPQLPT